MSQSQVFMSTLHNIHINKKPTHKHKYKKLTFKPE